WNMEVTADQSQFTNHKSPMLLSRRPAQLASAEQVQMQVEHRLPGVSAYVVNRAIPAFEATLARQLGGDEVRVADDAGIFVVGFLKARNVFLRDDEDVRRRAGID